MSTDTEIDDGLTAEERAALEDDEDTATTVDTDDVDDKAAEPVADDAAEPEAKPEPAAEEPAEVKQQPAPILVAPPPEDVAAKLADIDGKKDALLNQFDEGEITAREYQKQLDALAKEERALERAQDRAELAAQMNQQQLQNDWTATCNAFVEANTVYKDNPRLYKALDAEVRDLAAKPETANWSGQKFLEEAHKNLSEAFGIASPKANTPKAKTLPVDRNLPPNLAKVPAADVEDTNGGKYAVLDRLANTDPIKYEETLDRMSSAERDAYLAS